MFTKEIMNRNMNIYYLSGNENYELRYFSLFSMTSKGLKKYEKFKRITFNCINVYVGNW